MHNQWKERNEQQVSRLNEIHTELIEMRNELNRNETIVAMHAINDAALSISIAIGAIRYNIGQIKRNRVVL